MNIEMQFERLNRHYEICKKSYDKIAMWDLSHTLRILCELVDVIDESSDRKFAISKPNKKFKKIINANNYIYLHLPNPITTYNKSVLGEIRYTFLVPDDLVGDSKASEIFANIKNEIKGDYNEIEFSMICLVIGKLNDKDSELINRYVRKYQIEKRKFSQFMSHPFIYFKLKNFEVSSISRLHLIKRIANEYDASHPKKNEVESTNIYSEPVKELMKLVCAGLPLPYFALLHIADEILANFKNDGTVLGI